MQGAQELHLQRDGKRFTAFEMGHGPLALCLHGFPDSPYTFKKLLPSLAGAGYRAVAVTLRGYERSSVDTAADYSLAALSDDIGGWLDLLGVEQAALIGHDWGANVGYATAARFPNRIRRLVTLAVPHPAAFGANLLADFDQMRRSWYIFLFQLRGVAELVASQGDAALLGRLWRDWSPGWEDQEELARLPEIFSQPGVLEAALGYYRTAFEAGHPRAAESQAILSAPIQAPTLGLCGSDDGCISAQLFESSMPPALFSGGVRTVRVERAGHFLHLEQPDIVHREILAHLQSG
jgi:pimeloyl-ACP methyl ester carboxylesterase